MSVTPVADLLVENCLQRRGSARLQPCENRRQRGTALAAVAVDDFSERTFFATSVTWQRRSIFRSERAARLFLDTLFSYRDRGIFQLYEFVLMPDHVHLLLAPKPTVALEHAMQFIKGRIFPSLYEETRSKMEIWERSFTNHRIRNWEDYARHRNYIHLNPVQAVLAQCPQDYPYFSANGGFLVDAVPQRLKPVA